MFDTDKINIGISINDGCGVKFTDLILSGKKTIETRNKRTLDPFIGEWVGLIRTGVGKATLVGYVKFGEPISYNSENFNDDYDKHYVKNSDEEFFNNGNKFGYPIIDVKRIEPRQLDTYIPIRKYKNQQGIDFNVAGYVARSISTTNEDCGCNTKQTIQIKESVLRQIINETIKSVLFEQGIR